MITKFARLEFELFTKPSKSDFLRVHQNSIEKISILLVSDTYLLPFDFYPVFPSLY